MKSILYARVSTKEQEKEGYSIPAQLQLLTEYAAKSHFDVVKEFIDVETAKKAGRENFGKMIEYLKEHADVRTILVEKTDRLYRNFKDYVFLEDMGLEIHLVKEGEILNKESKSHTKFIHGIKLLMAKNYIDNLSEETKKGLKIKAESGEFPGVAPFGYKHNKIEKRIEVDPVKAPIVKKIFELYASGNYSMEDIRGYLNDEVRPLLGKKSIFYKSAVENVLKNPIYYGDFRWAGTIYQGKHEPIIDRGLFETAQEILQSHNKVLGKRRNFAYTSLLRCEECGCRITAEMKKGRYVYYHCTGHKGGHCKKNYVREEWLTGEFANVLAGIYIDDEKAEWFKQSLKESHKDKKAYHGQALSQLRIQYQKLQDRLDKAYEDKLDGVITEQDWNRKTAEWKKLQTEMTVKIDAHRKADHDYFDDGVRIIELANKATFLYEKLSSDEKRKLLKIVLSNCYLDGKILRPVYKKPFDIILKMATSNKKLPGLDSNQRPIDYRIP